MKSPDLWVRAFFYSGEFPGFPNIVGLAVRLFHKKI